jgi:peptide/nickel transport system ATP-binding protein
MPAGCPFGPRCPLHIEDCDKAEPPLVEVGRGHRAACIRTDEVAKAHGKAAEVFDETSVDDQLTEEAYPAELAVSAEAEHDAEPGDPPPPSQTEPAANAEKAGSPTTTTGDPS